jgi:hypothetical protein
LPGLLPNHPTSQSHFCFCPQHQHDCLRRRTFRAGLQTRISWSEDLHLHGNTEQHLSCGHHKQQRAFSCSQAWRVCWLQPMPHFLPSPLCCRHSQRKSGWHGQVPVKRRLPQLCKYSHWIIFITKRSCGTIPMKYLVKRFQNCDWIPTK